MKSGLQLLMDMGTSFADGRVQRAVDREVSKSIRWGLGLISSRHKQKFTKRGKGPPDPVTWTHRTRELSRSFQIYYNPGALEGAYGSELPRAAKIEKGGEIRPKNAKYLAIPMHPSVKYGKGGGMGPRAYPGLVFLQSLAGQPMLVRPHAAGPGFDLMFLLRRRVTLPPRPALDRTWEASREEIFRAQAKATFDGVIKGLGLSRGKQG